MTRIALPALSLAAAASCLAGHASSAPRQPAASETTADDGNRTFDAADLKELQVASAAGQITLKGGDGRQVKVTATKKHFDSDCSLSMKVDGDELEIENREPKGSRARCEVDFVIELPRSLAVAVNLGAGNAVLTGLGSDLSFKIGSGDLRVSDSELREVEGTTGSGDVQLTGTLVEAEIKIGSGDADITLSKAPAAGKLDIKVGTGTTRIHLPKDARVRTEFKSGLGTMTNEFHDTSDARFTISGQAGVGDLTIKKL